jgi:O-antigen ligase
MGHRPDAASLCKASIRILLFLVPLLPLVVTPFMFFPFVSGKSFAFRVAVEMMLGFYAMLALLDGASRPRLTPILRAVLLLVFIILVADLLGENRYRSFWSTYERMDGFVTLLHLAIYYLVATCVLDSDTWWRRFWNTSIVASVLMACYGLLQHAGWFAIYSGGERIDATLNNASFLAIYLLFHMFLAGLFMLKAGRPLLTAVYATVVVILSAALFLTATRSAILGLVLGSITSISILLWERRRDIGLRRFTFGLLAFIFSAFTVFAAVKDMEAVRANPVASRLAAVTWSGLQNENRFQVWSIAVRAIVDKPLLGWGQENFNYAFNRHFDPRIDPQEQWFDRVHNVPLDWLIAGGIAGFLAYALLFAALLRCLWRRGTYDGITRSLITGLLAGYAVHNMFTFDNLVSYVLFFSLLASVDSRSRRVDGTAMAMHWELHGALPQSLAALLLLFATMSLVYNVNVPAMRSAMILVRATSPQPEGPEKNLELFMQVLAIDSFGRNEAVEQLANVTTEITASKAPLALKNAFHSRSTEELNALARREIVDARYSFLAGKFFNHYRQYDAAIPYLKNAVTRSPNRTAAHEELGRSYLGTRDVENAFAEFSTGHALQPQFPDAGAVSAADESRRMRDSSASATPETEAVIEYVNVPSDHYMVTANLAEAFTIDRGERPGWTRTGNSWRAWTAQGHRGEFVPVCRFYGRAPSPLAGENAGIPGHHYAADPAECAARLEASLAQRSPASSTKGLVYEGTAFFVQLPENGICPLGTTPVYRMRKGDPDHFANYRFVTAIATKRELVAKGWIMEPNSVAYLCGAPAVNLIEKP